MHTSTSKNGMIVLVVAIIFIAGGYFYLKGSPTNSAINSLTGSANLEDADASKKGAEILLLLSQLRSLRIDTSIFDNQSYKSLIDYTVVVPSQNVGKANPFASFVGQNLITNGTKKTNQGNRPGSAGL